MEYVTKDAFDYCKKSKTKIAKRVYERVLNYDLISVVKDGERFWFEKTCSWNIIPEYAYKFLKTVYKKQGLKYIYE